MESPKLDYSSLVDTSRPFSSVKEAVAVFGERILVGEIYYSPKPPQYLSPSPSPSAWSFCSPRKEPEIEKEEENNLLGTLKKIEWELEETKKEVKMLKERERETEIAVASLNAELHNNMSKMAVAEANKAAAAAAAMATRRVSFRINGDEENNKLGSFGRVKLEKKKKKKKKKKKPVIPLVGDFFLLLLRKKQTERKNVQ